MLHLSLKDGWYAVKNLGLIILSKLYMIFVNIKNVLKHGINVSVQQIQKVQKSLMSDPIAHWQSVLGQFNVSGRTDLKKMWVKALTCLNRNGIPRNLCYGNNCTLPHKRIFLHLYRRHCTRYYRYIYSMFYAPSFWYKKSFTH